MTALVLQARLESTRLPQKSLLPLGGRPLILRVMEALNGVNCEVKVLACPESCVSAFAPLAAEAGFEILPGPGEDVLARYCLAARRFKPDRIVRATGDNPFVLIDAAEAIRVESEALGADYAVYSCIPHGSGVQCVSAEALLRAEREAPTCFEREHVCPYLYNHPELFRLHLPLAPLCWQGAELNVTVDTPEDYENAKALYRFLSTLPLEERSRGAAIIAAARRLSG